MQTATRAFLSLLIIYSLEQGREKKLAVLMKAVLLMSRMLVNCFAPSRSFANKSREKHENDVEYIRRRNIIKIPRKNMSPEMISREDVLAEMRNSKPRRCGKLFASLRISVAIWIHVRFVYQFMLSVILYAFDFSLLRLPTHISRENIEAKNAPLVGGR